MSDLDFLIPRDQFARADASLRHFGFASPTELRDDFAPRLTNYRAYVRDGKNPAHIELHWHLFKSPYYWWRVPIEWFWEHTTTAAIQNQAVRVFSPEAQCLHLATHFALHHRAERLIWSYDLARLIARDRTAIDWGELIETVERFGLTLAVASALTQVADTWGVCPPDDITARLRELRSGWRDRAAFALMTAPRGEARFLLDTLSQPGASGKARFLWYHLFPSQVYLQERYPTSRGQGVLFVYLSRFANGILKFFRSFVSTLMHS